MMKRIGLMIVATFISVASMMAQGYETSDILVGFKGGPSYTTLTGLDGKYKIGGNLAAYIEVYLTDNLTMDIEFAYTMKGAKDAHSMADYAKLLDYNLDYFSATYLVKYYFNNKVGAYAGLNTAVLARGKVTDGSNTEDIRKYLHRGDFGPVIGAEYVFNDKWTIDGRWMWSPRTISNSDFARHNIGKTRNQTFTVTLGYKFQVF